MSGEACTSTCIENSSFVVNLVCLGTTSGKSNIVEESVVPFKASSTGRCRNTCRL
uniref:Uncharacterized protein n=1 Tax=Physcomitrium patens TaxID=3218 RepID=A0A2K1JZ94_PHYPA|nr:hypothetical protein PHYPA_013968 [Physcomitrium patens]